MPHPLVFFTVFVFVFVLVFVRVRVRVRVRDPYNAYPSTVAKASIGGPGKLVRARAGARQRARTRARPARVIVAAGLIALLPACAHEAPVTHYTDLGAPFVSAADVPELQKRGALLVDARRERDYAAGHIDGAVSAWWQAFVPGERTGRLLDDAVVESKLRALGVRRDAPVVVYGAWNAGWGEEGRIAWMLEYLGHDDVHIVAGGFDALVASRLVVNAEPATKPAGDFVARPHAELRVDTNEVRAALERRDAVVIDTRRAPEYAGATMFGEARGGHVPGAVLLPFADLFASDGSLLSASTLRRRFAEAGVREDTRVILYCTGGIRSGFVVEVLRALGLGRPANYDGSFWEWARMSELPVERGPM